MIYEERSKETKRVKNSLISRWLSQNSDKTVRTRKNKQTKTHNPTETWNKTIEHY